MRSRQNKQDFYRGAYKQVIDKYTEVKSVNGTSGAFNYLSLGSPRGGSYNPRMVQASLSDFIADVELAARKGLSPREYQIFKRDIMVRLGSIQEDRTTQEIIKRKLGQAFMDRKIYPTGIYFRPVDTR